MGSWGYSTRWPGVLHSSQEQGCAARKKAARAAKKAAETGQDVPNSEPVQDITTMDVDDDDLLEEQEVPPSREGLWQKLKRLEGAQKLLKADTPAALRDHLEAAIAEAWQDVRKVEPAPSRLKALQTRVERRKLRLQKLSAKIATTAKELEGLEASMERKLAEVRADDNTVQNEPL
eukprot:1177285-Amphidinium_carterae.2